VANILNQEQDLRVVAEAGNGVEALEAQRAPSPGRDAARPCGCRSWKASRWSGASASAIPPRA
jgi:hypothetical protein